MKEIRQRKIVELIEKFDIETQEELAIRLNAEGFNVTQATVSRDIKELMLTKSAGKNGKQKYSLKQELNITNDRKYIRILKDDIISMDFAGNLLVVKTVSGMAMAVGAAIDKMKLDGIIGTIAGDDTVMCAVKNVSDIEKIIKKIEDIIKNNF